MSKCPARKNHPCVDFNSVAGCQCDITHHSPSDRCPVHGSGIYPPKCYYCNRFIAVKRRTFYGSTIDLNDITHQHLSNIYWFDILLNRGPSGMIKGVIKEKFGGRILMYSPHPNFKQEKVLLQSGNFLNSKNEIIYKNIKIGEL